MESAEYDAFRAGKPALVSEMSFRTITVSFSRSLILLNATNSRCDVCRPILLTHS